MHKVVYLYRKISIMNRFPVLSFRLFKHPEKLLMVVEYAPHGSLREFLRDRRPNRHGVSKPVYAGVEEILTLRDFVSFTYQIARGMEYLASMKVRLLQTKAEE